MKIITKRYLGRRSKPKEGTIGIWGHRSHLWAYKDEWTNRSEVASGSCRADRRQGQCRPSHRQSCDGRCWAALCPLVTEQTTASPAPSRPVRPAPMRLCAETEQKSANLLQIHYTREVTMQRKKGDNVTKRSMEGSVDEWMDELMNGLIWILTWARVRYGA